MKRLFAGVSVAAIAAGLTLVGPASAVDEHAPHGGAGSHPHHVHTGGGECVDHQPSMEGGARGIHRGANESGPDHGMWHGSCATHNNHG